MVIVKNGLDRTVFVRFKPRKGQIAVTETPISVPVTLGRFGLSDVVNHLLGLEPHVSFDFLVNDQCLRTSLDDYLLQQDLSTEYVLDIEYFELLKEPTTIAHYPHDDWVSAIAQHSNGFILTGSYDHNIRIWNESRQCIMTLMGHTGAIKGLSVFKRDDSRSSFQCASGSSDGTLRVFQIDDSQKKYETTLVCEGHKDGVNGVVVNHNGSLMASGSSDGTIRLWSTKPNEDTDIQEPEKKSRKRKEASPQPTITKHSISIFSAHSQSVTGISWPTSNEIMSASLDHTIRLWDSSVGANTQTLHSDAATSALAVNLLNGIIVSSHADQCLRVWDRRVHDGSMMKYQLNGHSAWISSVSWKPNDEFTFATGGFDHHVKIWDMRSQMPLYTIDVHEDNVLGVLWCPKYLLSGGADNKLSIHAMV